MVGKGHIFVNFGVNGLPLAGAENVVDAHVKCVGMIADARSVATLHIAVGQPFGNNVMGIGDGTIVEVAAEQQSCPPIRGFLMGGGFVVLRGTLNGVDVLAKSCDLRSPQSGRLSEAFEQLLRLASCIVALHVALYDALEVGSFLFGESGGLQMAVDNDEGVGI